MLALLLNRWCNFKCKRWCNFKCLLTGICLTDTFQLYEKDDLISELLVDNSARRTRQKNLDIRVIMANPPYSSGQKTANDNNANVAYPNLDENISNTYAAHSKATSTKNLMDSYIRAFRWGSDRLGTSGIMAYVSNAGWIDGNAMDGMRQCLKEEFSSLYVFHLRGNQRTQGELSRKEGGKIFGAGSRAPIAISILVKNPNADKQGQIYYHDIGDYLTQAEKLSIISNFKSIGGITGADGWQMITPDSHNDWLDQRDDRFDKFIEMGNKKNKKAVTIFANYSLGVATGRDTWCYNFSIHNLTDNMSRMIDFYNQQVAEWKSHSSNDLKEFEKFIDQNPQKISWSAALKNDGRKGTERGFSKNNIVQSMYRPFTRQVMYYDRHFNERVYQMPRIFPDDTVENKMICVTGVGARAGFSALMVDALPCLDMVEKGQCFPLKLYEKQEIEGGLFGGQSENEYTVKDGITDDGLSHFKAAYPDETLTKEDIFYYIYGLLHCPDYRRRYGNNLSKQVPRIPCVKTAGDFWAFTQAGRTLAKWHVDYETVVPYPVTIEGQPETAEHYHVTKMKFGRIGREKDKSTVIYNPHITIRDIPLAAYDYIVNGKAALDWVMDRQCVKTDKASGIVNDANLYAVETMNDPAYPLKLFQRIITVSLETMKIVHALPELDIEE